MIFDAIRSLAALAVLLGHADGTFPPFAPDKTHHIASALWPQQMGVVVFFLLSGYLITETLDRRLRDPKATFADFAIDRFARIYSAFLPAILVVALIDIYSFRTCPYPSPETISRFTPAIFIENLFMLQAPDVAWSFGSGNPFWSVAIEFWIYMFVGLSAFALRDGLTPAKGVAIIAVSFIPLQSIESNNLVFVPWVMGALVRQMIATGALRKVATSALIAAFAAGIGIVIWRNILGEARIYDNLTSLTFAATFLAIVALSKRLPEQSVATIIAAWFARWSYSLYLLHHSVLQLFHSAFGDDPPILIPIVASIALSIAFAELTEVHHRKLGAFLKRQLHERVLPYVRSFSVRDRIL